MSEPDLAMSELDLVVGEFLVESRENLDQLDRDLVAIERTPDDHETLNSIFRTIHTIKGTCSFFDFPRLEAISHAGETLLSKVRDGELAWDRPITSALLNLVDVIRQTLETISTCGAEDDADQSELIARLMTLCDGPTGPGIEAAREVDAGPAPPVAVAVAVAGPGEAQGPTARTTAEPVDERAGRDGGPANRPDGTIRVEVGLLDVLMDLVGELVLARNQILQSDDALRGGPHRGASQRLDRITSELQEGVMKARMQPIGHVWNTYHRIVRDLAIDCGKLVRLEMEGEGTELDKTIIEKIKDPLIHLIRNAIDHGLEPPDARRAQGKPPEGLVTLRAFHEGGQVHIEISDDGAGISPSKVRQKAVDRGLITAHQAGKMDDVEAIGLIFLPGFSTAERITNVSGRGVGMDVVKTNVELIGGTVEIQSLAATGTVIKVRIPLTLAIIPALIVSAGGQPFAIPQASLLELASLASEGLASGIEWVDGVPLHRLRGSLLPLVRLDKELGMAPSPTGDEDVKLVVLQAGDRRFGLIVEDIRDTEEVVVKPLGKQLRGLRLFSGATILGDGQVALILDVGGLALRAGMEPRTRDRSRSSTATTAGAVDPVVTYLVVDLGDDRRMAIPLEHVTRLEELPASAVERTTRRAEVVQYRGQILPLIRLADGFLDDPPPSRDPIRVVIASDDRGRTVGLVVDAIHDIVTSGSEISGEDAGPGLLGTTVILNRVTDLLDVSAVVRDATRGRTARRDRERDLEPMGAGV